MTVLRSMSAVLAIVLVTVPAWAGDFNTKHGDAPGNTVRFEVTAPLETIVAATSSVSGSFDFNPNDVMASKGGSFVVDVSSFDSGIALRDEHFRDNFLHTSKHPKATFTIDKIKKASKKKVASGESVELKLMGTLDMHGVKHQEEVNATVSYFAEGPGTAGLRMSGNLIGVNASFDIALADYNIERPQMLVLKVGEIVNIDLASRLSDAPKSELGWCGDGGCGDSCGGCGDGCGGCGDGCGGCGDGCGGCGDGCGGCGGGCGGCGGCDGGCGGCGGCGH